MTTVLRIGGAMVAGVAVAMVLLVGVELFSAVVHPLPEGFGGTQEEMCAHVARYPAWVLAVFVPMWAGVAFVSTWIAGKLANRGCALLLGALVLAALVLNLAMLPYPLWFKAGCLVAIPAAIAAAVYLSGRRGAAAVHVAA